MADNLGLDYDEVVILKETSVAHGGVMAIYTDELILTNKKIICLGKGVFGGTKKVFHYPLDQIKVFNGIPQVQQGKLSNGTACLDVYLVDGEEHFNFQTRNKKTISVWIEEIRKLFGKDAGAGYYSDDEDDVDDEYERDEEDDDSVLGAFKEVGEEFKDVGREFAEAFGFKIKKKNKANNKSNNKNNGRNIPNPVNAGGFCTLCGKPLAQGSKFCPSCGASIGAPQVVQPVSPVASHIPQAVPTTPQEVVCPSCGKKLDPSLRFCTECGTEINSITRVAPNNGDSSGNDSGKEKIGIDQQIELLQKLKGLVDAGIISQEEFEKKKKEII